MLSSDRKAFLRGSELPEDVNNEPSKGRKSFAGRGSSMILGPGVAKRNELGRHGASGVGLKHGSQVGEVGLTTLPGTEPWAWC